MVDHTGLAAAPRNAGGRGRFAILCCGEALIDMLPGLTADGEACFVPRVGGAVFNTAVALGRLGVATGFFSGLSTDPFGTMLRAELVRSHVDTALAVTSARPTTLAFVTLENGEASYSFHDEGTAGRMLDAADLPALPDAIGTLFMGGIHLASEPAGAAYEALAAREAERRLVMLDPNIRPALVGDEPSYRARLARMIALADILKLSDADLRWLSGPGDIAAQAKSLLGQGPKIVIVTQGARGATAFRTAGEVSAAPPPAKIVDTVGAGDAFNAGLLAALWRTELMDKTAVADLAPPALRAALDLANRVAAATVARAGANPPWENELCGH